MVNFSDSEQSALFIMNLSISILSLLGSLFMVTLYFIATELRVYAFKLVFFLSLSDLIKYITIVLSYIQYNTPAIICSIEGFLLDASQISNCVWCLSISVTLYQIFILQQENIEGYFSKWAAIAIGLAPSMQLIPFITGSYGADDNLCTLRNDFLGNLWRLICVYIPTWALIFANLYYYCKLYLHIRSKRNSKDPVPNGDLLITKTQRYPFILIITITPLSLLRLMQVIDGSAENFYLEFFAMFFFNIQGLINAFAYGYNDPVRNYMLFKCCKKKRMSANYVTLESIDMK